MKRLVQLTALGPGFVPVCQPDSHAIRARASK